MKSAGEPGDRWLSHRKMARREESPDTVPSHREHPSLASASSGQGATRLVTPGERISAKQASACGNAIRSRKVPQKIDRRGTARWHRAGKPARCLRTIRW